MFTVVHSDNIVLILIDVGRQSCLLTKPTFCVPNSIKITENVQL